MLNKENIYKSSFSTINGNMIILSPHPLLRPYIANYTFTDPSKMHQQQTILPTISSTLVCTFQNGQFTAGLRGVNTKPTMIADYARQFDFMFLVEFHASGLYPFLNIDQHHLADKGFLFADLNQALFEQIAEAYCTAKTIHELASKLDQIFLEKIDQIELNPAFCIAFEKLLKSNGSVRVKDLAKKTYYSEKQLNRLFMKYTGAKVKTCSRIIRMKRAVDLLHSKPEMSLLFEETGHHDYAHFIHDFTAIYGITPKKYMEKMSLFYNDPYKL